MVRVALVIFLCIGITLGGWIGWFYFHSDTGGRQLLIQARRRIEATHLGSRGASDCIPANGAVGELVIPSIGLVAPVVEGDGEGQLADAVGHVPTSVWPGEGGASVLVAHDVTWFHDLPHLRAGAGIEYVSSCADITYRVQHAAVVAEGTTVANASGTLDLVTCWPLDALWFTNQRYLVQAVETGGATRSAPVRVPATPEVPLLAVPPSLTTVDSLAANPTPLGTLRVSGTPSPRFGESPGPLADATAVQDVFFGALRASETTGAVGSRDWSAVAPGVPPSAAAPLSGARVIGFGASLTTVIRVTGERLIGGSTSVQMQLTGADPGIWTITASEGLVAGRLAITGWAMEQ